MANRFQLGLPPECPNCNHSNWVYKITALGYTCQRHRDWYQPIMFKLKMMPGQEPYSEEELAQVQNLITGACQAEEATGEGGQDFGYYELEDHAQVNQV